MPSPFEPGDISTSFINTAAHLQAAHQAIAASSTCIPDHSGCMHHLLSQVLPTSARSHHPRLPFELRCIPLHLACVDDVDSESKRGSVTPYCAI